MNCVTTSAPQNSKPIRFPRNFAGAVEAAREFNANEKEAAASYRWDRWWASSPAPPWVPPCHRVLTGSAGAAPRMSREAKTRWGAQHRCFSCAPRGGRVAWRFASSPSSKRWQQVFRRIGVILRWCPSADNVWASWFESSDSSFQYFVYVLRSWPRNKLGLLKFRICSSRASRYSQRQVRRTSSR